MKVHSDPIKLDLNKPVITLGIFDGVHLGHKTILKSLKDTAHSKKGQSVVITFWPHPRAILDPENKNLKFLTTMEEKIYLLEKEGIDHLVILPFTRSFSTQQACEFIENVLVNRFGVFQLLVGYNHKFGKDRKGDFKAIEVCAEKYKFHTKQLKAFSEDGIKISSTLIRDALWAGQIEKANKYLGYTFFLNGTIVGGKRIGSKIGFPTANIMPLERYKILPSDGVYAVRLRINKMHYRGMLNIGMRPTIDRDRTIKTIEVNIFDFSQNIYGQEVQVLFVERIRNEKQFISVNALVQQLKQDEITAREILAKI